MSETSASVGPRQYLHVFRRHVLEPIQRASARVDEEREMIAAERRAFEQFGDDVTDVTPPPPEDRLGPATRPTLLDPSSRVAGDLRDAYRETVMDVPHFESEYGESLEENLVAELGPDVAHLLTADGPCSFTSAHKGTLARAVEKAVAEREQFGRLLDTEGESLAGARRAIAGVVESIDDTHIPEWYRHQFESELEDVLGDRQATLQRRPSPTRLDGHNLCEYLYSDEPWTYPVLTAVVRLRETVTVGG